MTNHLSEEELILHYYGEHDRAEDARVEAHLAACHDCQGANERLRRVMTLVDSAAPVEARPGFERDVWARLEPQLDTPSFGWRKLFWFPQWALAGGVAALVMAAFVAGRFSTGDVTTVRPPSAPVIADAQADPERVLHAAVGDHLDRTQLMLFELVNSDVDQPDMLAAEQGRAADLVAANRLIRQSAEQSGDSGVADVLDDLERVLLEIANAPAGAASNELSDLKSRIAAQDLLFRVRVISSEMRQRTRTDREDGDRQPRRLPTS